MMWCKILFEWNRILHLTFIQVNESDGNGNQKSEKAAYNKLLNQRITDKMSDDSNIVLKESFGS